MPAIDFSLRCVSCNHDLRGTDAAEDCPGCARPVAETLRFVRVNDDGMAVCGDVPCLKCDYNLRTLSVNSVCPECAKPVHHSLQSDLLHFADVGWLRRVRRGVTWLILALVGVLVVPPLVVNVVIGTRANIWGKELDFLLYFVVTCTIACVPWCLGAFAATSAEPRPRGRAETRFPRIAARRCTLALFILPALLFVSQFVSPMFVDPTFVGPFRYPSIEFAYHFAAGSVFCMAPVFGTLAIACVGVCLRRLARRARRPWLSRLVTTMIGLVLAGGVLNAVTLFGMIFIMPAMPINGLVEVQTNMAGGIVMSACYVTGLVVLFKCRRLLTAALANR